MEWEMGGRFKREGIYACLWLIHEDGWQKPAQYCKVIILQLKKKKQLNASVAEGTRLCTL